MTGFELLFATIRDHLQSKYDVLVSLFHWNIIQNGFKCVGTGETFPEDVSSETPSELLPLNWNSNQNAYILRYTNGDNKLLLKCIQSSNIIIITALMIPNGRSSSVSINPNEYVNDDFRDFKTVFKTDLIERVTHTFNTEMFIQSSSSATRDNTQSQRDPLMIGEPQYPNLYPRHTDWDNDGGGRFPPPIGGADLDPLGRGSGGMLMDPREFPRPFPVRNPSMGLFRPLPPGAVPPGARFDPFGPPIAGPRGGQFGGPRNPRFAGPDPDHMPPPGYDDMFM